MGLYAVAHLAARHGIRVQLRPGIQKGLSALVWLPGSLAGPEPVPAAGSRFRRLATVGAGQGGRLTAPRPAQSESEGGAQRRGPRSVSGEQPPLAGQGTNAPRQRSAWFAAKRPSGDPAGSAGEPAADWGQQAANRTGSGPYQGGQTNAGLPRRSAPASAHPGPGVSVRDQAMSRRHSPQAARDRLSGFRIGSSDALPTRSEPAQAPHEKEGNNA
jgi:hypothetical protein